MEYIFIIIYKKRFVKSFGRKENFSTKFNCMFIFLLEKQGTDAVI